MSRKALLTGFAEVCAFPAHSSQHFDQLLNAVAEMVTKFHEITRMRYERAIGWLRGDRNAPTTPEIQESLVAEGSESAQDRIAVHAQLSGQVSGWGETLAGRGLSVGYRPPDLRRDLLM